MKASSSTPGPRHQALIELLRTAETLWNASRLFFAKWRLSPSQFNILNLLQDQPDGISQIELSRQLLTHRSNVTGLIDRLETRGLVKRNENATDRRAFSVLLTARGEKLIREILPHYYLEVETVWKDVPEVRTQELIRALQAVAQSAKFSTQSPNANSKADVKWPKNA